MCFTDFFYMCVHIFFTCVFIKKWKIPYGLVKKPGVASTRDCVLGHLLRCGLLPRAAGRSLSAGASQVASDRWMATVTRCLALPGDCVHSA